MIYGFMFLAALSTTMMVYAFLTFGVQSFLSMFFMVASVTCWAISAIAIQGKIEDLRKKIEELEKRYDDKKD